jgi:A/G-specific adenine glycosylase
MNRKDIVRLLLQWFAGNARDLPWRRTRDPYAIWVSEIMLQQTQVKTVLPYWDRWMRALPDIAALAGARREKLHKLWEGLGYYTRVRNLQKAAQIVIEEYGGRFPEDFEQVLGLPGIGRYTAGAICSIAFNQPKPILDGNVVRVLSRLFGVDGNPRNVRTRAELWRLAEELVGSAVRLARAGGRASSRAQSSAARRSNLGSRGRSPSRTGRQRHASAFNQSLMELGALVCTPRQPRCAVCPVAKHCVAHREDRMEELPRLTPRVRATPRRFVAFVAQHRDRFLVRQRPAGVVNAHLWEFPNAELAVDDFDLMGAARSALGLTPKALQPLCVIKHSITRYRITLTVFRVAGGLAAGTAQAKGKWLTQKEMSRLPFGSAHKRILRHLECE